MKQSIQQEAIEKISGILISDMRISAIFVNGSIARDEYDSYSNVDYYCVVEELEIDGFLADRVKIMEHYRPLIYHSERNSNEPCIVGVFDNGLRFDFHALTRMPTESKHEIKSLYDPQNLLKNHIKKVNNLDNNEIAEYVNEFSLRLLEFEAAYYRRDFLWASRLGSHLIENLSKILSHIYDKSNPFPRIKGLMPKLPIDIKVNMLGANKYLVPRDVLTGIRMLIEIMESALKELDETVLKLINIGFLQVMKERINNIKAG